MRTLLPGALVVAPFPASAQEPPGVPSAPLSLFFDCQGGGCWDMDFYRREIPVVNWVRDREAADLHVLITSQATGGGGRAYTLAFVGRSRFEGQDGELTVSTSGDATDDEARRAIADRLKLGLVRYLAATPLADQITVTLGDQADLADSQMTGPSRDAGQSVDDPWNYWVFQIRGNAFLTGESSYSQTSFSGNVSANRTTDAWKLSLSGRFTRVESEFTVSEDEVVTSLIEDWTFSGLLVKSLTEQWSAGVRSDAGRSSRRNEHLRWSVSPGVEFNFLPYSESSRRSLTLQALLNVRHWDYLEETIFGETSETRVAPSLTASLNQVQPWGRTNVSLTGSQYLHDMSLYRISLGGFMEFRLFRGFSVNVNGSYAWIRDQLFPAAEGASTEEILLRQRSLETSFNYFTSFGITYRFGSIFNNVVNPRFGDSGRFFF